MKTGIILGFFVAIIAAVLLLPTGSAAFLFHFSELEVNGVHIDQPGEFYAAQAGETLNINYVFATLAGNPTSQFPDGTTFKEARITARVLGEPSLSDSVDRDLLPGRTYSIPLSVTLPNNLDELDENFAIQITVETQNEQGLDTPFNFYVGVQRSDDGLEILSVESDSTVQTGDSLAIDVVVKNRGRHLAEDTFVEARIPELGISRRIFLQDLSALDQNELSNSGKKDDSAFGTIRLNIPSSAPAGLYNVVITAFNGDTQTSVTRRIEIVGGGAGNVFASSSSKTFAAGTSGDYSITLVNSGNRIMVYTLVPEADDGLTVNLPESVVAVPAGSSKTVDFTAMASRDGKYNFKVAVHGANGAVVAEQAYTANVEGKSRVSGNATVVLTIVLAIIFIVLLVVLIVLLTRKPEKTEEFGESYY